MKPYRVEVWQEPLARWWPIIGSQDNKSYAFGFAHGIKSLYPSPRIRVTKLDGAEWVSVEEFGETSAPKVS